MSPIQPPRLPEVQIADNEFLLNDSSMIIYGDSGIGKTTIARCMPNPLFLMMRSGGEHRPAPLSGSMIPFMEIHSKSDLDAILLEIKNKGKLTIYVPVPAKDLADAINQAKDVQLGGAMKVYEVKTIVIDQLPSMHAINMNYVMTNVTRNRENPDTPNQQDYQQVLRQFSNFLQEINNVPNLHKIYLALAEIDEDRKTGDRYGAPSIPGKLALDVLKYVDFVFRMHIRREQVGTRVEEYRCFQTQPEGIWRAKDSTGKLPKYIKIPDRDYNFWEKEIVPAISKK